MLEQVSNFFFEQVPFIATWLFFTYLTVVLDERILSRRTIEDHFGGSEPLYWASLWLPIIMLPLSASIGLFWVDPYKLKWDRGWSVAFFLAAGAVSQISWLAIKWLGAKKGIKIALPGMSYFPPKPESTDVDTHDL